MIRLLLVDDHPIWRDAIAADLQSNGFDVAATASSVREALDRAPAVRPDVAVVDLHLPDGTGVDVVRAVVALGAKALVLSASGEEPDVLEAVTAGASGYLLKSVTSEELRDAVTRTAAGEPVFTPALAGLVLGAYRKLSDGEESDERPRLTERETEVLKLVATGMLTKQIATRLGISPRTVENHVANTLSKLQLANRVQLTRYAVEQGLA